MQWFEILSTETKKFSSRNNSYIKMIEWLSTQMKQGNSSGVQYQFIILWYGKKLAVLSVLHYERGLDPLNWVYSLKNFLKKVWIFGISTIYFTFVHAFSSCLRLQGSDITDTGLGNFNILQLLTDYNIEVITCWYFS